MMKTPGLAGRFHLYEEGIPAIFIGIVAFE